jgi:DNA ligase-1
MSIESTSIYSRDSKGKLRHWRYEVDGGRWRGISGLVDGKETASGWTVSKPKNVGKKNETTVNEQAALEAEAELRKKLDREYRRTEPELDNVPPSPMLAQKFKDAGKRLKFSPGYIHVQPKLDGIRMFSRLVVHAPDDPELTGTSRDYQPFGQSVQHILSDLAPLFTAMPDLILDGELYNHIYKDNFNKIGSLVRKEDLTAEEVAECHTYLQYHIYDVPSLPGGFVQRSQKLAELFDTFDLDLNSHCLVRVPTYPVDSIEEGMVRREKFLLDGYEGMMWRMDEPYEFDTRSWSLLKDKDFIDAEFPVTRVFTGEGNWDGVPKALEFKMTDDRRAENGERPKAGIKGSMDFCRSLIGKNITSATIRYFALTPAGVPRLPVATDIHFDGGRKD